MNAPNHTALLTLDMDYARKAMPDASGDDVRLAAMHKARHALTSMPMALRIESAQWLKANGMAGLGGMPLEQFE